MLVHGERRRHDPEVVLDGGLALPPARPGKIVAARHVDHRVVGEHGHNGGSVAARELVEEPLDDVSCRHA